MQYQALQSQMALNMAPRIHMSHVDDKILASQGTTVPLRFDFLLDLSNNMVLDVLHFTLPCVLMVWYQQVSA